MKWNINYPQKRIRDAGLLEKLDHRSNSVLTCLDDLAHSPKREAHPRNTEFTWIDLGNLVRQLPVCFNNDAIERTNINRAVTLIQNLREIKLIETLRGGKGNRLWFRITDQGRFILGKHQRDETGTTNSPTPRAAETSPPIQVQCKPGPPPAGWRGVLKFLYPRHADKEWDTLPARIQSELRKHTRPLKATL